MLENEGNPPSLTERPRLRVHKQGLGLSPEAPPDLTSSFRTRTSSTPVCCWTGLQLILGCVWDQRTSGLGGVVLHVETLTLRLCSRGLSHWKVLVRPCWFPAV